MATSLACLALLALPPFAPGSHAQSASTTSKAPATKTRPKSGNAQTPASASASQYHKRADVQAFIGTLVERHGLDPKELEQIFAGARAQPDVLRLIAPAPSGFKRSWASYRSRFLDKTRIRGGVEFRAQHAQLLERAEAIYGVPSDVIVAIIGVETIYGRVTGNFRIIDALTTLAFDYPRRAEFFRSELEHFLLLVHASGQDPFEARGSYAGAIGLPQFMPGSIRRYAVDFDRDGRIDLQASAADAIGSVARFLAEHGWVPGGTPYYPTRITAEAKLEALIEAGIEPRFTTDQLSDFGVSAIGTVPDGTTMALIDLPNGDAAPTYLLGARNFYVVTRYNRSSFYATAVLELADALRNAN